ncbi:MAG TPA: phosphate acyltransferase PlsX [Acidobacteriaceae bacterium]|nr:phosphate acyltransferase PlsX [Acidobacteriaceae bacterium]
MNQRTGTKHKTVRSRLAELGPQLSAQLGVQPSTSAPIASPERIAIVLDAMGSDKSPAPEIAGAILACKLLSVRVLLTGPEDVLRPALDTALNGEEAPIEIVHASEWISMDDKAAASVRTKRDSSMRVGLKLVREKKAAGFFSAGNTGAAMATAKMVLGALSGVDRPALAAVLPTVTGTPCILLDVGANVDCNAQNLQQFAVMGNMYASSVLRISKPRLGLLSIGEEETKGNALTHETFPLFKDIGVTFVGNVEGRDLFNGTTQVVVCDGFVGNVALKTSEGLAKLVRELLRESLTSTVTAKVGAMLSRQAFNDFKKRLDYSEYGGAPLLGVRGVCIVGHGSSNERAIMNGIRVAAEFAQADINTQIEEQLATIAAKRLRNEANLAADHNAPLN